MKKMKTIQTLALCLSLSVCTLSAAQTPVGSVQEGLSAHTPDSLRGLVQQASVGLPASVTGKDVFIGPFKDMPATRAVKVPVVVFLHGSSGLGLPAIAQWQRWLAKLGYASIAPDSFALNSRLTYKSPVDTATYERIHALRLSEIAPVLEALKTQPWAQMQQLVLAGTSEGAVPVSRYAGAGFAAKIIYAWGCEKNYFVEQAKPSFDLKQPVLNIISAVDPFFSKTNGWLGNDAALGHCGAALKNHPQAAIVLIPDAPHTLITLPAAQHATAGFLMRHLGGAAQ